MTKVDSRGRVVLPQDVREDLGITPGTEVEIYEQDGKVVIEPEEEPERIIERIDELITGISDDREPTSYDELDPQSKDQVETIRRQAQQSDSESIDE